MQNKHKGNKFSKNKPQVSYRKLLASKPNEDEEIVRLPTLYDAIDPKAVKQFSDFPLSWKTLQGLKSANYKVPTEIQKESIGNALQGRDILGAAITGSGKTLAFLIPIMENLYLKKWTRVDGVGAIIISPTRELAYQIFETLKKIGSFHEFSAGLIIGGKNLKFEKNRMDQCNIIICTPGRLLQHMDENPLFNTASMHVLVLDEADRCLDMGFEQTMNGIIDNLPPDRQTLLFSATQTRSVKDLARLSLENPVYVAPNEQQAITPSNLQQNYVVIDLEDKITMLWSFIKNHLKQKVIIFLSSCKQVKYIYEIFCKLRPGTSLLALYGTLHQDKRVAIYNEFCRKSNVVMFATDIASRGLDFPVVNWVVQLDCPEDVTQYIHRAGRTARHNARGESLLVLLPSEEEGMVEELESRKVSVNQIHIDPKKMFTPRAKMEAFLAQNQQLKESAQRAFVAYIKSVFLMKNKAIFNVDKLNTEAYAKSLGLVVTPRVRFLERFKKRRAAALAGKEEASSSDEEESEEEVPQKKKNDDDVDFNLPHSDSDEESDEENDLITIKRKDHKIEGAESSEEEESDEDQDQSKKAKKVVTKAAIAKRVLKKKIVANKKVVFDEEGEQVLDPKKQLQSDLGKEYLNQDEGGIDIEMAKKILQEEDKFDKQRFKELVKAKHKDKKKKAKRVKDAEMDDFGESDDDENDVDLSWLPDPDRVYRKVANSDSESEDEEEEYGEEESQIHKPPSKLYEKSNRKRKISIASNSSDPDDSNDDLDDNVVAKKTKKMTTKLSVNEAEMIAMQLLGK